LGRLKELELIEEHDVLFIQQVTGDEKFIDLLLKWTGGGANRGLNGLPKIS